MRTAIDLQPAPPEVLKPIHPNKATGVTLFYGVSLIMVGYIAFATVERFKVQAAILEGTVRVEEAKAERDQLQKRTEELNRKAGISNDLTEWLAMSPPAQVVALLLSGQVEPNISFSRMVVDMEPGAPNAKISIDLINDSPDVASRQDNSSRQINKIQAALEKAGFKTVNIEADQPSPEGWRFVTIVALPQGGDFKKLFKTSR